MMLIKILTWLLIPVANAFFDRKGEKRNYLVVNTVRGIIALVDGVWFLSNKDLTFNYSTASAGQLLMLWAPVLSFQLLSYWLVFEIVLNALRHNPILYYDHKEGDSGYVDRFFKWAGFEIHFIAKFASLILLVIAITKLYTNGY